MLDTNEFFEEAVKGSTLYSQEHESSDRSGMGSKVLSVLLLTGIAYIGFVYYSKTKSSDEALVVKKEVVAQIKIKPEQIAMADTHQSSSSEEDYLNALKSIESELAEEKTVHLETKDQLSLSAAMNNLIEDTTIADNTTYAKELKKEIGVEVEETKPSGVVVQNSTQEKARKIIVKKGDTLQGLSSEFYGDPMNYKRIIASNENLHTTDDTIYVGQTIFLPY
jgi:nucleoid-associated protein YgaU